MTMPVLRAALVAATLGVALAPVPAFAQKLTIADGPGDAWQETYDDASGSFVYTEAGSPVNSDVLRSVVRHKARTVTVRTTLADLRNNTEGLVNGVKFRTNEGLRRDVFVLKDGNARGVHVLVFTGRGKQVRCSGITRDIDWAGDAVTLDVPRSCLSAPRWVQVTVAAGNYAEDGRASYVDVAGKTGYRFSGWSAKVRRG